MSLTVNKYFFLVHQDLWEIPTEVCPLDRVGMGVCGVHLFEERVGERQVHHSQRAGNTH